MPEPKNIFLAPCSREQKEGTYRHFQDTVLNGVDPSTYPEIPEFEDDEIAVWGVVSGNQSAWEQMDSGDVLLFYTKRKSYTHAATVLTTQENDTLAQKLWTPYDEGRRVEDITEGWPYIIYLTNIKRVDIHSEAFHEDIGWQTFYPQSFTRVIEERKERLVSKYGSLTEALRQHTQNDLGEAPEAITEETEQMLSETEREPPELMESETEYTETQRRVRSSAFREAVLKAYDESCAVCGAQRYSPAGNPEVEAAHIYPKSEGGSDDVRNGLALCKFHHWAFDNGWISITDEHEIIVREKPGEEAYDELTSFDGKSLSLPEKSDHHPHQIFLREHRRLHGFEEVSLEESIDAS
ncbi:HNH endonuclease [Natronorubrum thiooxidans]|uniref:Putative restriction endonuclease n=1 Tax=Natronorubrum thiooxidans TaxID=308853 RepID=A0A1N7H2Z3_9EURY|nr:HNH endonuclease [Natronorubrum thiooxidans]SIS19199.1 putative restriction endonuclease [Natronorubrum thiooxidans]